MAQSTEYIVLIKRGDNIFAHLCTENCLQKFKEGVVCRIHINLQRLYRFKKSKEILVRSVRNRLMEKGIKEDVDQINFMDKIFRILYGN